MAKDIPGTLLDGPDLTLDYRTAFDQAPIGLVLSRQRQIV